MIRKPGVTSKRVARIAGEQLGNASTPKRTKSVDASTLRQRPEQNPRSRAARRLKIASLRATKPNP